ncbi:MAG: hypothetical protein PHU85_13330 [Phycisphaerae bacterium]|nr:hypothetical protein [Phycisphaerae bacterium]
MTRTFALATIIALLCPVAASAFEVKLTVAETAKVAREPAVVTSGVPFAKGAVKDLAKLAVSIDGKAVPAQFLKLAAWDDGSIRWALMDVQVKAAAGAKVELTVSDAGGNPAPAAPVKVDDAKDTVAVSTGPLQFVVDKAKPGLFQSFKVDGKDLLTAAGRGLVLYKEGGGEVIGTPTAVTIEQAGPMRAIVCIRGKFPGVHNDLLTYTARITAYAGQKFVKTHLWLENNGSMGYFNGNEDSPASKAIEWFPFDGLAVEYGLGLGSSLTAGCEDATSAGSLKVLQTCLPHKPADKNWRGGRFGYTDLEYVITGGGKEIKKGDRTDGVVSVKGDGGSVTAAVRNFWENYEKAIELDGTNLKVWLWPTEGQWPRVITKAPFDKSLDNICKAGLYDMPGSVHKGHEFMLDLSGRDPKAVAAELSSPLFAFATAEHYAGTEASPGMFAPPTVRTADKDCNAKLDAWVRMTRSAGDPESPASVFKAREQSPFSDVGYLQDTMVSHGWMDFGDVVVPGRGPISLGSDWAWISLLSAMRLGDPNYLRLGSEMTRHYIDIDQLWSDRDLAGARGFQRGGYNWSNFHCYRLSRPPGVSAGCIVGVVQYYLLTGEPKALECAERSSKALRAAWKAAAAEKKPLGGMSLIGATLDAYYAMYDLTADKTWVDDTLGIYKDCIRPMWKSMGPFLHGTNQIQFQDYVKSDQAYCFSIASLCQLHRMTGDEDVLEMLVDSTQKTFPDTFFQAPLYLADVFGYVAMVKSDKELLAKGAELMASGFPESKCPPVFMPGNGTWCHDAAMMLRAGHVLQYATWKMNAKK